jgi:flavin reductase (DIM6/NTAB) family NADH-FMN oxidoreductase RutF
MNRTAKKHPLQKLVHGGYIVTAGPEAAAHGIIWLNQTSFTPPLIMVVEA